MLPYRPILASARSGAARPRDYAGGVVAHGLLIMGLVIAMGGKFVGVAYIALTEHKSTVPWIVLSVTGYVMALVAQVGPLSG